MNTVLYFFNYDLTDRVIDSGIAPYGFYSETIVEDTNTRHLYYHGTDNDGLQLKKNILELNSFEITNDMVVFKY